MFVNFLFQAGIFIYKSIYSKLQLMLDPTGCERTCLDANMKPIWIWNMLMCDARATCGYGANGI